MLKRAELADGIVPASGLEPIPKLQEPEFHVGAQLSDLSCTIQSLQKQSQSARAQVSAAGLESTLFLSI